MSEPIIADTKPVVLDLNSGTYYWCSCGQSQKQPFGDGSHQSTKSIPLSFVETEDKR